MRFLLFFCLLITVSCSTDTKQLFFDIPPPSSQELAEQARLEAEQTAAATGQNGAGASLAGAFNDNLPRPEIEGILDWEKAFEMLPKDARGRAVDWTAALEQGLVRPRTGADPRAREAAAFKYDFIIETEKPKNNAIFPHSAHTGWLGCKNCHTTLFPYKRNPATMKEMRAGASCGACHGKVAFSLRNCKVCHINK